MRIQSVFSVASVLTIALASGVSAKSVTVQLGPVDIVARTLEDRGRYYVVTLGVPGEIAGARLDTVLLEFYLDVAADVSVGEEYTPCLEVYPLTETPRDGQMPRFDTDYPSTRTVSIGDGQHVLIDITEIVKGWIALPSSNHGLVVGSFGGAKMGDLEVRNDLLGSGKLARATFFYQNRFGQPVSSSQ